MIDELRTRKVGTPWKLQALNQLLGTKYGESSFCNTHFYNHITGRKYLILHNFEEQISGRKILHKDLHEDGFTIYECMNDINVSFKIIKDLSCYTTYLLINGDNIGKIHIPNFVGQTLISFYGEVILDEEGKKEISMVRIKTNELKESAVWFKEAYIRIKNSLQKNHPMI